MPESSQVLRISRIELQNAGKVESAQLIISGSRYEVQKQQGTNILSAEFSPPLEVQEPFYLSLRKLVLGVWKWYEKKKSFDPREVLSKLEDHRFRSRIQGDVTIVLDIPPPNPPPNPPQDTAIPHTPTASGSLTPTTDEILRQCPRFRILIVGKVGVGKTSLINRTFGIDDAVARPEHDRRGEANIETPLYSKSNERFVLHDSKGFEPGEKDNLSSVKAFIERRKTHEEIQEQLHAVWLSFQVPLESLGQRLMEAGMEEFLRKKSSILGNIPTIFVFTKYDMLTEDIERKWIQARKPYSDAEVDLEADQYLKKRCIQRIEELTGQKGIPYIAVSSKPRFQGTLTQLTELTYEKVSEYFVERHGGEPSPVPVVTAVAQRVASDLKIEGSISVGKRRYWKAVISGADFSGHTIMDCIHIIHTDIVMIWNFYDPLKLLLCDDFRDFMLRLVDTLDDPKTLARRDTSLTAEGGAALVAMIPIRLSIMIGTRIVQWARETYKRVPEVQRKFIAYIADLTHVLDIIFTLVASRREKQLTIRTIKAAIVTYQTSMKRRDVHAKIKELPIALVGGCNIIVETETFVKSRYITDEDLKKKIEEISQADLEGEEDWNPPQSHGGN